MGEPSLTPSLQPNEDATTVAPLTRQETLAGIRALVEHQFPGATVQQIEGIYFLLTVHSTGETELEAMRAALKHYHEMERDGKALPQLLGEIAEDLKDSGMSRQRHDSLLELCDLASQALNGGVIANVIPWIMIASYTRQIEDLRRRITVRLSMVAQNMKQHEESRRKAKEHIK
jgi:hypothetical protein